MLRRCMCCTLRVLLQRTRDGRAQHHFQHLTKNLLVRGWSGSCHYTLGGPEVLHPRKEPSLPPQLKLAQNDSDTLPERSTLHRPVLSPLLDT
jgi:hypothetical protein